MTKLNTSILLMLDCIVVHEPELNWYPLGHSVQFLEHTEHWWDSKTYPTSHLLHLFSSTEQSVQCLSAHFLGKQSPSLSSYPSSQAKHVPEFGSHLMQPFLTAQYLSQVCVDALYIWLEKHLVHL